MLVTMGSQHKRVDLECSDNYNSSIMNTSTNPNNEPALTLKHPAYKWFLALCVAALAVPTVLASLDGGPISILEYAFDTAAGVQLFLDLLIALLIIMIWIWRDAKNRGRQPLPWIILTFAIGSFGPLLYLLFRKND